MTEVQERSPSTAVLVRQAIEQLSRLIRDEMALARAEMASKSKKVGFSAGLLTGSLLTTLYGIAALLASGTLALAIVMPDWLAALLVGAALLLIASVLGLLGRKKARQVTSVMPAEALHSVQDDIAELKGRARR